MTSLAEIAQDLAALRKDVSRLKAAQDIQNLMGTYTVNHMPKTMHDHVELFAMERHDVSVEIGDRGVLVGPDALRRLFGQQFKMELEGNLLIHYLATPMIEVAGDGETAKGVWRSPGIEAVRPPDGGRPVPLWSFGSYACDFIRIGGQWKIWHLHWFRTAKCSFHDGWADDLSMIHGSAFPAGPGVRPTTYHNPYSPTAVQEPVPPCPQPYETWQDDGWAVREQILKPR